MRFSASPRGRFEIDFSDPRTPGFPVYNLLPRLFGVFLGVPELRTIFRRFLVAPDPSQHLFDRGLAAFRADVSVAEGWEARIPRTGPVLVIANHPSFGVETLAIGSLLRRVRSDVKIVLVEAFAGLPGVRDVAISLPAATSHGAAARARAGMREMSAWLAEGHVLVVHPAGLASWVVRFPSRQIFDGPWRPGILSLIAATRPVVVPTYVGGGPSPSYPALWRLSPWLGGAMAFHELARLEGARIPIAFGEPFDTNGWDPGREGDRAVRTVVAARALAELRRLTYLAGGIAEPD